MLALHGIIICSAVGLIAIQKCMMESYFKDIIWDIFTAYIQPYCKVYALRDPLVYQYAAIQGIEHCTKIKIDKDIKMDPNWIMQPIF